MGASIELTCRQKIDTADIFVVLVTNQSIESDYVDMEVSHALWVCQQRPLLVLPVLATQRPRECWPLALRELARLRGLVLEGLLDLSVEKVVIEVCRMMRLTYVTPQPVVPRLPLARRLAEELNRVRTSTPYDVADFERLMRRCNATTQAFEECNYDKARRLLTTVLVDLEEEYGLSRPYYPRIVLACIGVAEAYQEHGAYDQPVAELTTLIEEANPLLDANAFVARGNARTGQGRYAEAIADYAEAEGRLTSPDPALFYNIVRARTLGSLPLNEELLERSRMHAERGLTTQEPGDLAKFCAVLALAYAYRGDAARAREAWLAVRDMRDVFPELVLDICHHLHRHALQYTSDRPDRMLAILDIMTDYAAVSGAMGLAARLQLDRLQARVTHDLGDHFRARRLHRKLALDYARSPVAKMDAALYAALNGDEHYARTLCDEVARGGDYAACAPRLAYTDFEFVRGQAMWMLGMSREADECFRKSRYPGAHSYEGTLPILGSASE